MSIRNKSNHEDRIIRINEIRTTVRAAFVASLSFTIILTTLLNFSSDSGTYKSTEAGAADAETTAVITTVEADAKSEETTTTSTTSTTSTTTTTSTSTSTTSTTTTTTTVTTTSTTTEVVTTAVNDTEVEVVYEEEVVEEAEEEEVYEEEYHEESSEPSTSYEWTGDVLTPAAGRIVGPSGQETYYNLNMDGVISLMQSECGLYYEYKEREDGVKTYGGYVMVAANFNIRPRGTIVQTSLGPGIVCDTGSFAAWNPYQLDIAVNW